MALMSFRPTFWPTVFTIPAVLVLLALGTWQLQRMQWKEAQITERVERTTSAPVPLPRGADLAPEERAAIEYRRAVVTGTFLHDREMYLAARSMRGNPGYQVVTPFRLAEPGSGAGHVLINRGWIPIDRKDPATRQPGLIEGEVAVDGIIRLEGRPGWMVPDNQPEDNIWFWVDLPAMAAYADLAGDVAPVYLDAGEAEIPGTYPLGGQTRIQLPNDHLQYALTWYSLAVALVVIYFVYHRRKPE